MIIGTKRVGEGGERPPFGNYLHDKLG